MSDLHADLAEIAKLSPGNIASRALAEIDRLQGQVAMLTEALTTALQDHGEGWCDTCNPGKKALSDLAASSSSWLAAHDAQIIHDVAESTVTVAIGQMPEPMKSSVVRVLLREALSVERVTKALRHRPSELGDHGTREATPAEVRAALLPRDEPDRETTEIERDYQEMTFTDLYRSIFGYHRQSDLGTGPKIRHGIRLWRDDAPSGNRRSYSLNSSVVLSELAERARLPYGKTLIPTGPAVESERRYGIPDGTYFEVSANISRRSIVPPEAQL
jgi:hypothetical protein